MTGDEIRSYRDLKVWKEAMELAVQSYELTRGFPRDEVFGMTSQIRRSAASIAANIAEGYGRNTAGHYVQFLRNAQGSLKELETHLLLSARVGVASEGEIQPLMARADSVGRMLRALAKSIQQAGSRQ